MPEEIGLGHRPFGHHLHQFGARFQRKARRGGGLRLHQPDLVVGTRQQRGQPARRAARKGAIGRVDPHRIRPRSSGPARPAGH
jgi:hypothetical protein